MCLARANGASVLPVNGSFGARIAEILNVYQIPHTVIDFGFGKPFNLDRIKAVIAEERQCGFTAVAMTNDETSAGLLNPVAAVGALARQHSLKLIVDATSSAGVEDLDVTRDGIDACITTPENACMRRRGSALSACDATCLKWPG